MQLLVSSCYKVELDRRRESARLSERVGKPTRDRDFSRLPSQSLAALRLRQQVGLRRKR